MLTTVQKRYAIFIGIHAASCYLFGLLTFIDGRRTRSTAPWALVQCVYGIMPLFGLSTTLHDFDEETATTLHGISNVLILMTMMLMISGSLVDIKCIKWDKCHIFSYCFILLPLWSFLFLYPAFSEYEDFMLLCGLCGFAFVAACLMLIHLGEMGVLLGAGGLIMTFVYIFEGCAVASRVFMDEPVRTYGQYIFGWLAVCMVYILFHYVHVTKDLGNDKEPKNAPFMNSRGRIRFAAVPNLKAGSDSSDDTDVEKEQSYML